MTASSLDQAERAQRDLATIEAYRAGDAQAFDELVRRYQHHVARILLHLNAVSSEVEDLTQDVFLRVYRHLDRFRGQSSFYTWLYRISVNVFFDHNKKRKRADVRLMRLQRDMADATNVRDGSDDPFRHAFDTELEERLRSAIGTLPEPFRDVVALREVGDLSYEEIALTTGISIGTVRSRLSRARTRLKTLLSPVLEAA